MAISRIRIVGADKTVGFLKHAVDKIADPNIDRWRKPSGRCITVILIRSREVRRVSLSNFDFNTFEWGSSFDEMTLRQLRVFGELRHPAELYVVVDHERRVQVIIGTPDDADIPLFPDVVFDPFFMWSMLASLFSSQTTLNETAPTAKHDDPPNGMRCRDSANFTIGQNECVVYWTYRLSYQGDTAAENHVEIVRKAALSDYQSGIYR